MIVISGALVLVALVLLVIGLIGPSLGFVYASIAASLAAFAFLVVGILQRRKEEPAGAPTSAAEITAAIRTPETSSVSSDVPAASGAAGDVLVVEGRPRYHVAGCRYLTGKDARALPVATAQADGYSACGVCKPDEALAAAAPAVVAPAAEEAAPAVAADDAVAVTSAPARTTAARSSKATARATARTTARSAGTTPAKAARAAKAAPASTRTATKTAAKATKAPVKATRAAKATTAAPAKKAPAKAATKATATKATATKATKKAPAKKAPAKKAPAKTSRSTRG